LVKANLTEAVLDGAALRGADLSEAVLKGADLRGTYLVEQILRTLISPAVASTVYPRGV
jgi:uncharacterized protein YjbI with pentapeptide repeats